MTETTAKQNRAKRRRALRFEKLVQAGLAVIGQRGLYETTVEHITEAAGVGKGMFYAHCDSKEELVFHLVRHGFDDLMAARMKQRKTDGSPSGRLTALILGQLRALARRRDLVILLHQVRRMLILQPEARRRLREEYRRYVQFLMEECRHVLGAPDLGQGAVRALVCAIAGFVVGTLSFEMLVRGNGGTVLALTPPVKAFAAGVAGTYAPARAAARVNRGEGDA